MRRKLTLPVCPPVAIITALRARTLTVAPLWFALRPTTRPEVPFSR